MEKLDENVQEEEAFTAMLRFENWLKSLSNDVVEYVFVSDNPCFDWQFINYYFYTTLGRNPFGFSGRRIGDLWAGMKKQFKDQSGWRKLVRTEHTHHPTEDAIGHAEAFLEILKTIDLDDNSILHTPNITPIMPLLSSIPINQHAYTSTQKSTNGFRNNRDWICPICKVSIFGSKKECKKCYSQNPNNR
jgi:hypothetical protein